MLINPDRRGASDGRYIYISKSGVEYTSRDLSAITKHSLRNVQRLMRQVGGDVEAFLALCRTKNRMKKLRRKAKRAGIPKSTFHKRINRRLSQDLVLSTARTPPKAREYPVDDDWLTIREMHEESGIAGTTLRARVRAGIRTRGMLYSEPRPSGGTRGSVPRKRIDIEGESLFFCDINRRIKNIKERTLRARIARAKEDGITLTWEWLSRPAIQQNKPTKSNKKKRKLDGFDIDIADCESFTLGIIAQIKRQGRFVQYKITQDPDDLVLALRKLKDDPLNKSLAGYKNISYYIRRLSI